MRRDRAGRTGATGSQDVAEGEGHVLDDVVAAVGIGDVAGGVGLEGPAVEGEGAFEAGLEVTEARGGAERSPDAVDRRAKLVAILEGAAAEDDALLDRDVGLERAEQEGGAAADADGLVGRVGDEGEVGRLAGVEAVAIVDVAGADLDRAGVSDGPALMEADLEALPRGGEGGRLDRAAVSYTHLRAHETPEHLVCRL